MAGNTVSGGGMINDVVAIPDYFIASWGAFRSSLESGCLDNEKGSTGNIS